MNKEDVVFFSTYIQTHIYARISLFFTVEQYPTVCVYICMHTQWNITHTHTMEYYSTVKKMEFCHLQQLMLSEISHAEKDKYCMISLICGIYKTKNKHNTPGKRVINTEDKEAAARGERCGGERNRGMRSGSTHLQVQREGVTGVKHAA